MQTAVALKFVSEELFSPRMIVRIPRWGKLTGFHSQLAFFPYVNLDVSDSRPPIS